MECRHLLRELFLQHLTSNLRMVLASSSNAKSLDEQATLAKKVLDEAPTSMASTTQPPHFKKAGDLHTEVASLKELVASLSSGDRPSRYRSPSP